MKPKGLKGVCIWKGNRPEGGSEIRRLGSNHKAEGVKGFQIFMHHYDLFSQRISQPKCNNLPHRPGRM